MFRFFSRKESKEKLDEGLSKTKTSLFSRVTRAIAGKSRVDDDLLDELEEILISSDVGVDTTLRIIERLQAQVAQDKYMNAAELQRMLKGVIQSLLAGNEAEHQAQHPAGEPFVTLVVGVNGVGKTTTIGKLANLYRREGRKVLMGAADTFRAAAIDQLQIWAERADVPLIKQQMGSDPASVAFDTVSAAKAGGYDVVLIDTAGRLHNKVNLMNELGKIKRVMQKVIPGAPHEILLVLDASTGQNAYEQATQFMNVTDITALALTKLDGTARGGVAIGISDQLKVPIRYIGVGEGIDDLQPFDKVAFVDSLFD
ncbi:MAG: signal recognition particle-docking protein FtsY [Bacteroidia bacterium]|nr:MAG: signal recognition particle-docking protein FtsY [Bacteroidia bacterium]